MTSKVAIFLAGVSAGLLALAAAAAGLLRRKLWAL